MTYKGCGLSHSMEATSLALKGLGIPFWQRSKEQETLILSHQELPNEWGREECSVLQDLVTGWVLKAPHILILRMLLAWWLVFSHLVTSDSLWPCRLQPTRFLCPQDSPGKNPGVSCHFLLQGIFWLRDRTQVSCVSCIAGGFFTTEQLGKSKWCSQRLSSSFTSPNWKSPGTTQDIWQHIQPWRLITKPWNTCGRCHRPWDVELS